MLSQAMMWTIFYGAFAGSGYAFLFYLKAVQSGAESFSVEKFVRGLLIGLIVGAVSAFSGVPVTEQNYDIQVMAYGFVTVLVDQIIKLLWRARTLTPPRVTP